MTPEQALMFLIQMVEQTPAPKAAHMQAENAIKILRELITKKLEVVKQ